MTVRAVLYCRVSTSSQSVERQIAGTLNAPCNLGAGQENGQ
jgi:DNA invertase Pin-like site-specific DNA recombinase